MANFDDLDISPDYGASKSVKPNVQKVQFGDGYSARYAFGLNTQPQVWSLRFELRDEDDANSIDEFLADKGAVTAFEWTPPGASDPLNFICDEWTVSQDKPNLFTVQATFTQVFDP